MIDAFGQDLNLGDEVICVANLTTTQTLYAGHVVDMNDKCATVLVAQKALIENESLGQWNSFPEEKRVCLSHRLAKR